MKRLVIGVALVFALAVAAWLWVTAPAWLPPIDWGWLDDPAEEPAMFV